MKTILEITPQIRWSWELPDEHYEIATALLNNRTVRTIEKAVELMKRVKIDVSQIRRRRLSLEPHGLEGIHASTVFIEDAITLRAAEKFCLFHQSQNIVRL